MFPLLTLFHFFVLLHLEMPSTLHYSALLPYISSTLPTHTPSLTTHIIPATQRNSKSFSILLYFFLLFPFILPCHFSFFFYYFFVLLYRSMHLLLPTSTHYLIFSSSHSPSFPLPPKQLFSYTAFLSSFHLTLFSSLHTSTHSSLLSSIAQHSVLIPFPFAAAHNSFSLS